MRSRESIFRVLRCPSSESLEPSLRHTHSNNLPFSFTTTSTAGHIPHMRSRGNTGWSHTTHLQWGKQCDFILEHSDFCPAQEKHPVLTVTRPCCVICHTQDFRPHCQRKLDTQGRQTMSLIEKLESRTSARFS